jgi:hypothetical protein
MQPHRVPPPRDDAITRACPRANIQAAIAGDGIRGHWYLHYIALPDSLGDFTPYQTPDYAERGLRPPGEWLEALAEVFGPNHAQSIARRGLEAGAVTYDNDGRFPDGAAVQTRYPDTRRRSDTSRQLPARHDLSPRR